ncbi:MAG: transglutaminase-like domain-containing protein [Nanoarchaeota archaeon]
MVNEKSGQVDQKRMVKYFKLFQKYFFKYFLISICSIILLLLIVFWALGVFTICGDHYCTEKECNSGCKDCSYQSCVNNICQPQVGENCNDSVDCTCDINQVCAVERAGNSSNGCYEMKCGDGFCDSKGENNDNCCLDCGCESGYTCNLQKNECQFQTPELGISVNYVTQGVSASSLYSNRELIDDDGNKHPLSSLRITNNGTNIAKNIILSVRIGKYTEEQKENLGDLEPGAYKDYEWYPTATGAMLTIMDDQSVLINVVISFEDEHGENHDSTKSIPLTIVGRDNWGTYSSVSQFVTPIDGVVRQAVSAAGSFSTRDDEGIQDAARKIWDLLKGLNIDYISDPTLEYRQYPAEVISRKKGDCDDLATLYVALLESVGIKTALITHPGHMYAAYYDSKFIYPIETTMLTTSFDDAWGAGNKEFDEHKNDRHITLIEDEWKQKNIKTPGDVGIEARTLSFPNIQALHSQSTEWVCTNRNEYGCLHNDLVVYCDITFVNSGTAEGQKCVNVLTYVDEDLVQQKVACETVDVGDREEQRVTYTDPNHANVGYTYLCEIK